MAKTKDQPYASYVVDFYENKLEVTFHNFEKINHRKIEDAQRQVHLKWDRERRAAVIKHEMAAREKSMEDAAKQG